MQNTSKSPNNLRIGVLALQGAFREHANILRELGAEVVEVRLPKHLDGLHGLVIPGGESTTIGKLAVRWNLMDPLREKGQAGFPIWGTCAGAIFLSQDAKQEQHLLKLMNITVERNAFGRQLDSFEADLDIKGLDAPFPAVFIRAPVIDSVGEQVDVLCALADGRIVAAREGNYLVTSFHPELTDDSRFHQLFLDMVQNG